MGRSEYNEVRFFALGVIYHFVEFVAFFRLPGGSNDLNRIREGAVNVELASLQSSSRSGATPYNT